MRARFVLGNYGNVSHISGWKCEPCLRDAEMHAIFQLGNRAIVQLINMEVQPMFKLGNVKKQEIFRLENTKMYAISQLGYVETQGYFKKENEEFYAI